MESTSYVLLSFRMVFFYLVTTHGLDFLHQLCVNQNQILFNTLTRIRIKRRVQREFRYSTSLCVLRSSNLARIFFLHIFDVKTTTPSKREIREIQPLVEEEYRSTYAFRDGVQYTVNCHQLSPEFIRGHAIAYRWRSLPRVRQHKDH